MPSWHVDWANMIVELDPLPACANLPVPGRAGRNKSGKSAVAFATLVGSSPSKHQVSRTESMLLATVAHELRTPLTSLRLSLDMLVADFDELPEENVLRLIQRAKR